MWLDLRVQRRLQAAGQAFVLDVALQCTQRQVVLAGPSGAGKSLTLKAVAGLLRPGQGHVRVQGQAVFDAATGVDLPPQRRRLGYVFQDYALFPHLSVRQNVAFGLQKGWLNPRIGQRFDAVEQWLHAFRIDTVGDLLPSQISGGQRQRTALARALVTQPQALLLDEPFSALDHDLRQHLRQELEAVLDKTGIPLLLISHDPQDVAMFGQQVARMVDGRIVGN
ncbi:TPA: ATP-binding cassette domain-containing protein [Stenotrophomonas maltophilia]|nr:ATP-binding cassette domain-containing protein [Stenotrophomonas maltophilia]HDS1595325.1 ATP-binding cassette domain-containing protein [Stenotrophomonas maltophilia]